MWDFFLDLINVNENLDYSLLVSIVVGYFFIIWFIISLWVFFDARKRHSSVMLCILYWFFVFIFGPPALIFYIMIRPEHTLEEDYLMNMALSGEKDVRPIYFDGEKGFDISINLSVQPKEDADGKHKMNMNVEWFPLEKRESTKQKISKKGDAFKTLKTGLSKIVKKVKKLPKEARSRIEASNTKKTKPDKSVEVKKTDESKAKSKKEKETKSEDNKNRQNKQK